MADLKFTVERLGKISYDEWATRMEMLLNVKQLGATIVANGAVTDAQDRQAKAIIGLHCESASMVVVKNARTARQAWTRLQQIYAAESRAQQVQLRRELNTMQKDSEESIMEYFARGATLRDRLVAATGVEMSDGELVAPIFAGLPEYFQTAMDVLLAKTEELSITDAMTYLMHREQRVKMNGNGHDDVDASEDAGSTPALLARKKKRYNGKKAEKNRPPPCYVCGSRNHFAHECSDRYTDSSSDSEEAEGTNGRRRGGRACAGMARASVAF